jgi:hypothetical protein
MAASDLFTLAQIADQVCLNFGDTSDITQAKAKKWINRALLRFSELGDWSWQRVFAASLSTVASTEIYDLSGVKQITAIYVSSPVQRKLTLMEDREFRRRYPNNTATGMPYYYREAGWSTTTANTRKLGFYPIPDGVYTIKYDYIRSIQLLSSDTDDIRVATGMPQHLVDLVIEMATAIGWKELDDGDSTEQMREVLQRLAAAYAEDQHSIDDVFVMAPLETSDIDKFFDPVLSPNFNE